MPSYAIGRAGPILLAAISAMLLSPTAHAQSDADLGRKQTAASDSYFQISTGIDYSKGNYGDVADTKVASIPISARYVTGPVTFRVSVPYVWINGPGSLVTTPDTGGGGEDGSGRGRGRGGNSGSGSGNSSAAINTEVEPGGTRRKTSGIGDVNAALTYSFDFGSDLFLDVTGRMKIPTASKSKRLGTGKVDFTAAAELAKEIGGAEVYVGGRRRFAGQSTGSLLRDTWGASAGISYRTKNRVRIGLDYDWQQSSFRGNKASSEITGSVGFPLGKGFRLNLYAATGLNSASVDLAGGAALSYRF